MGRTARRQRRNSSRRPRSRYRCWFRRTNRATHPTRRPRHCLRVTPRSRSRTSTLVRRRQRRRRARRRERRSIAPSSVSCRGQSPVCDFGGVASTTDRPRQPTPARRRRCSVAPGRALGLGKGSGRRSLGQRILLFDWTTDTALRIHASTAQRRGSLDYSTTSDTGASHWRMMNTARRFVIRHDTSFQVSQTSQ